MRVLHYLYTKQSLYDEVFSIHDYSRTIIRIPNCDILNSNGS